MNEKSNTNWGEKTSEETIFITVRVAGKVHYV
jgi:hypothetical protein